MISSTDKKKAADISRDNQDTPLIEEDRYEVIDGEQLLMPTPRTEHQRISRKLENRMVNFPEKHDLGEVFDAPFEVYFDKKNQPQPDILFISKERLNIIGEKNIQGAPDLVVEILSPSSIHRDTVKKKNTYAAFGVLEYWIVYPEEKLIEVYSLKDDQYQLLATYYDKNTLCSQVLKGFKAKLKEIF